MDFHSLTRKELQTLCKKNKIPANITNIAMADALTALENVVGMEEFNNQWQPQSPEQMAPESESPSINLRSASTRRKPIDADPETAQPVTRSRRTTTRRTIIDQDQENKKNLMETPIVPANRRKAPSLREHEISNNNTIETPLVPTNRRKQPSGSVQRTRQSVRLLEKSLVELSLKEKGRAKPVKMMDVSVANFEKTNDTQVFSLENRKEMKDVQQQQNKSDDQEVTTQNSDDLHNHVSELIAKKDDIHDETIDDMLTDKSNRVTYEMESVSVPVAKFPSETRNASEEVMGAEHCFGDKVYEENSETRNASEEVMEPEHCLASKVSDESPTDTNVDEDFGCQLDSTATECVEKEMMILENAVVALNSPKFDTEEELIDVSLNEAKIPIFNEDKTPEFVKQISHSYEENIPLSNLEVDSITEGNPGSDAAIMPIQFPRPTPIKSGSKKQATKEQLIILAAGNKGNIDNNEMKMKSDNKENIDSSDKKVGSKKDKVKKNKNIVDKDMMLKSLEDKSLRELTKMLKQKLQITNNYQNIVKQQQVGNTRPALQSLAENLNLPGEPKNEIS